MFITGLQFWFCPGPQETRGWPWPHDILSRVSPLLRRAVQDHNMCIVRTCKLQFDHPEATKIVIAHPKSLRFLIVFSGLTQGGTHDLGFGYATIL